MNNFLKFLGNLKITAVRKMKSFKVEENFFSDQSIKLLESQVQLLQLQLDLLQSSFSQQINLLQTLIANQNHQSDILTHQLDHLQTFCSTQNHHSTLLETCVNKQESFATDISFQKSQIQNLVQQNSVIVSSIEKTKAETNDLSALKQFYEQKRVRDQSDRIEFGNRSMTRKK